MKIFVAAFLLLLFFAGCSAPQGLSLKGIDVEKIKQMVDDPLVQISSKKLSAQEVLQMAPELNAQCRKEIPGVALTMISAVGPSVDFKVLVDESDRSIVCTIKIEKAVDGCKTETDCDDGLLSTVDLCLGDPKVCSNERVKECVFGDSFCPKGCTKNSDSDCSAECVLDSDCDDANISTSDSCGGFVKACSNETVMISGRVLQSCETDTQCNVGNQCQIGVCSGEKTCSYRNEVNGTICGQKKECFDGACVDNAVNKIKISGAKVESIDETSVVFSWNTNKLGNSVVKYGKDITYQLSKTETANVIEHSVVLQKLEAGQKYFYKLVSNDVSNLADAQYLPIDNTFFTCVSCDDSNNCTLDLCNTSVGTCYHEVDIQKSGCSS